MAETKTTQEFQTYKGRPLVRCGDEIYYGNMTEPYVIRLQIKSKKTVGSAEIADNILIQLLSTDVDLSPKHRLRKTGEKKGMYQAMSMADIWLERALKNKI